VTGEWRSSHYDKFVVCIPHETLLDYFCQGKSYGLGMWHVIVRRAVHAA
jgi:hypothetical protein